MSQPEPPHAAILADGRLRSHADIRFRALRAAEGFRAAGIGMGDAVALLLRNDAAFFEASLAAGLAGAYPVPLNWRAPPGDIAHMLSDCAARIIVAHTDLLEATPPPPGIAALVVGAPSRIAGAVGWDAFIDAHPPIAEPFSAARPAVIYTSGSTGRPKGVRRAAAPQQKPSARALAVYGFDHPEPITALIDGPLSHSAPNAYGRLAMAVGARIVLRQQVEPEATLEAIARHRVTHLHATPTLFSRMLRLDGAARARCDLSSLRHVIHGAAPCPPAVKAAMIAWWGPVIHEYYGSTETGLLTLLDSAQALRKPGSVGRALPGITLAILDAHGAALPPGEAGDVHAGSETLHDFTYVGLPERRAEIARGALVNTGDIGWLDDEGDLFLRGRKRDMIVCAGACIHPAEIEAALLALPGVRDCAVFGAPDPEAGAAPIACVEPEAGCEIDPEAIRASLEAALGAAQAPCRVVVMEALPREDSGKIFKNRLRARFGA